MAYQIKWTPRAEESYENNIAYLDKEWTEREIKKFVIAVDEKLKLIAVFPELFIETNKRKHIHRAIINKQITLFYRKSKKLRQVELLVFSDSRGNPSKLKKLRE
jgi:plasmid stabilization system protein ParE